LLFQPLHELELALGDLADASWVALVPKAEPVAAHYQVQAVEVVAPAEPLPHQAAAQYQVLEEAAVEHLAPSP
jgi:hypothetical protein